MYGIMYALADFGTLDGHCPPDRERGSMIARPIKSLRWLVPLVWLFGFTVLGQEPRSAAKPVEAAQAAAKPEIITNMTLEKLQSIIQAMGFEVIRDKDKDGKPDSYISFRAEGYTVGAQVPTSEFIWLYNVFTDKATLETVNEWNATSRFSRAYSNSTDKTVCLETEVIVQGEITLENIESQIKEFRDSVARWARFVIDHIKSVTPADKKQ